MKIRQFIPRENVRYGFEVTDKEDFFKQATAYIVDRHPNFDADELKQLFEEREETMSTGIGYGIAIPHVMYQACQSHEIYVFRLAKPIDFHSLDGNPVSLLFVMIGAASPSNIVNLQILAKLALMTKKPDFIEQLLAAKSADELYETLMRHD